jgi:hypothetical protein
MTADLDLFPTKDAIREALPLAYACRELGIYLDANGIGFCPWHADTNESFHLWLGNTGERYGCFPCDVQGDVFDLIQKIEGCNRRSSTPRPGLLTVGSFVSGCAVSAT